MNLAFAFGTHTRLPNCPFSARPLWLKAVSKQLWGASRFRMPHLFLCGLPSKVGPSGRIVVAGAAMVKTSPKGVVCLGLAREHHRRRRARSNEQAFKWPRRSLRDSHTISLDAQGVSRQKLLGQLEAENAALRGSVMDLVLQIEALRDVTNT
jgi:hypothetical protein